MLTHGEHLQINTVPNTFHVARLREEEDLLPIFMLLIT